MGDKRKRRRSPRNDDYEDDYDDDFDQPLKKSSTGLILVIVLLGVVGLFCTISVVAAIAIPNLLEARKHANESSAIGALRTINAAQSIHLDRDENGQYAGNMRELAKFGLIDSVLATGEKNGYFFDLKHGSDPRFEYVVTASPTSPEVGARHFKTDQSGVIFFRMDESGEWIAIGSSPMKRPR